MFNKDGFLLEAIALTDEIDGLRRKVKELEKQLLACQEDEGPSEAEKLFMRVGREKVFRDGVYAGSFGYAMTVSENPMKGEFEYTDFEEFRKSVFRECPDEMSKDEFFRVFDPEFHALYQQEKAEARKMMEKGAL